jgi:hypothetical protein
MRSTFALQHFSHIRYTGTTLALADVLAAGVRWRQSLACCRR